MRGWGDASGMVDEGKRRRRRKERERTKSNDAEETQNHVPHHARAEKKPAEHREEVKYGSCYYCPSVYNRPQLLAYQPIQAVHQGYIKQQQQRG
jgi:hypothetical protein